MDEGRPLLDVVLRPKGLSRPKLDARPPLRRGPLCVLSMLGSTASASCAAQWQAVSEQR